MDKGASEVFRTHEGHHRILVEQVIGDETVDWLLVERRTIPTLDKLVAHTESVKQWLHGAAVNWTGQTTPTGYEFIVAK
ncbi:hypothetical protein ACFW2V_13720 [Streptomyces sp. NPDC058947]|uniref:hypothetical protein n=1 Tax=Streptomyces sp. NPDC058947 TaxID=3346675 RepID=UPI0036C3FB4C